jgi:uncharacterized protein
MMDLVIFHSDCPDGFASAFIAKKRYPEAQLLPATHGQPVFINPGMDILVVDFSWKRDICEAIRSEAKSLTILDHHKTAEAELAGLDYATFDLNRSGATLTWDTLFPNYPTVRAQGLYDTSCPWYVRYVEDRDLWRFALPDSKEVNAYIMALPHTIEAWSTLDHMSVDYAANLGRAIRLHIDHYIEKVVAQRQPGTIGRYTAAVVNAAYPNISDVCNELCKYANIGVGWFERSDGQIQFSLRSVGSLDVSDIAKSYGGGGHQNAAGFQVELNRGRSILDSILNRNRQITIPVNKQ